jgi:hypothetical protein
MAIKDTSRKPYIEDNDTNIKVGIDLPIRRGNDKEGFLCNHFNNHWSCEKQYKKFIKH